MVAWSSPPCGQGTSRRGVGSLWGSDGRRCLLEKAGRSLCDRVLGGQTPAAGNGEHKAGGLETKLDIDQRRLESYAARLRPRTRGSMLLHPLDREPPPACSLLPGGAYKGASVPWVPLGLVPGP